MAANPTRDRLSVDGALRWIGDLDHPFYEDERQRFIWYEASAIGLQLTLMLQFLVSGALMIVMGADSYPFLAVGMLPVIVATTLVTLYAHRQGAPYFVNASDLRSSRAVFGLLAVAVFVVGGVRIVLEGSSSAGTTEWDFSTIAGAVTGAGVVLLVAYVAKRKLDRAETHADIEDF